MKLGMVSLHGTYNCPIWAKLYYKPFDKPEPVATLVVPVGKHAPLVGEMIIAASSRLELCFLQAT